jgi:hypothetical protein
MKTLEVDRRDYANDGMSPWLAGICTTGIRIIKKGRTNGRLRLSEAKAFNRQFIDNDIQSSIAFLKKIVSVLFAQLPARQQG